MGERFYSTLHLLSLCHILLSALYLCLWVSISGHLHIQWFYVKEICAGTATASNINGTSQPAFLFWPGGFICRSLFHSNKTSLDSFIQNGPDKSLGAFTTVCKICALYRLSRPGTTVMALPLRQVWWWDVFNECVVTLSRQHEYLSVTMH